MQPRYFRVLPVHPDGRLNTGNTHLDTLIEGTEELARFKADWEAKGWQVIGEPTMSKDTWAITKYEFSRMGEPTSRIMKYNPKTATFINLYHEDIHMRHAEALYEAIAQGKIAPHNKHRLPDTLNYRDDKALEALTERGAWGNSIWEAQKRGASPEFVEWARTRQADYWKPYARAFDLEYRPGWGGFDNNPYLQIMNEVWWRESLWPVD